jgi:ubiquinone/menaquinone biosynthesis C-methylase UbiE
MIIPTWFFNGFTNYRASRIANYLAEHIPPGETLLDCGCGTMLIAEMLQQRHGIKAFGTDVIHLDQSNHLFCLCSGESLAFKTGAFDNVCVIFALHHMSDPVVALKEFLRVTKKSLVVLEDVYQNAFELRLLKTLDYHGNRVISESMSFPFNFKTESEWMRIFDHLKTKLTVTESIRPNPCRPSRHRLFALEKNIG